MITVAVRWYLRYGLSYRDVEELLAERGVEVDHVTVYRWVQRFTPLFTDAARPLRHATGDRWFVDETYLKVAGRWRYLYRAVDQYGQVIDVLLSEQRDTAAARRFFTRAFRYGPAPVEMTTDKAGPVLAAVGIRVAVFVAHRAPSRTGAGTLRRRRTRLSDRRLSDRRRGLAAVGGQQPSPRQTSCFAGLCPTVSQPLARAPVRSRHKERWEGRAGPMRMLVVEDEVHLAEALRDGLRAEGFAVDVAHDGERGLELARFNPYDAIVLDLMLPRRHGYDVCRTLRGEGVWTPVLMLTAKDGEYDQADALDLGVDAYLTKPASFVVIVATLRALVRRGAEERPAVLRVGPLTLDPARHRVRLRDVPLQLRPREFALLHYLMRRAGEAVSKQDILTNVWDEFYEGSPNIVEVYVGYLRRKIAEPPIIETIRGVGYRLWAEET